MRGPAQTSEPTIQYLYQLIDAIKKGRILIPRFQRPLVWKWDRQSELLRSVRDGIPMGAIMLWRTSRERITSNETLAGHKLPTPPAGIPREYLLDGLQRLSTLFAALQGFGKSTEEVEEEGSQYSLGYDLEEQVFVQCSEGSDQAPIIPLHTLPDSLTLLRFQRLLKGKRADIWIERSDELAKSFREYKVPVIPIESDDLEVAARTLSLINRQGLRMGEADMIHALTWTPKFELRDRIESLRSELLQPIGWGNIDFDTIIKIIKAEADLDLYEKSVDQISKVLRKDPDALNRAFERLVRVAKLLRKRCGILDWELVPYSMQAVLLADSIRTANTSSARLLLADWFWLTTYGEMFAGLSGYRLSAAIHDLRKGVDDGRLRWSGASKFRVRPIPGSADFRAVRMKAVALMLARQIRESAPESPPSSDDPFRILAEHGRNAMFTLVPRHLISKSNFSSPGNRFLCDPDDASELRQRLMSGGLDARERRKHLIPKEALTSARSGDWNGFIRERLAALAEKELKFVDSILERHSISE